MKNLKTIYDSGESLFKERPQKYSAHRERNKKKMAHKDHRYDKVIEVDQVLPKNRVFCPPIGRPKQLFASEAEANNFIKWNADKHEYGSEKLRPYYCAVCGGWHISHQPKGNQDAQVEEEVKNLISMKKASKRRQIPDELYQKVMRFLKSLPLEVIQEKDRKIRRRLLKKSWSESGNAELAPNIMARIHGVASKIQKFLEENSMSDWKEGMIEEIWETV